ncbi:hypothetical protein [Tateyamaria sp. Alg231-49]|uniref:hypothetical protein n=1 Tax=Tateyamaria sp. Alg231-49 TaxID=1922219 RepID=UPI000D55E72E|nr:hypothetical protein [Tateyamaria sp. Alg231-49]
MRTYIGAKNPKRKEKKTRAVPRIYGHEAQSIRKALEEGQFEEIEYRLEYNEPSNRMEAPDVKKAVESAKWKINKKVDFSSVEALINKALSHTFGGEDEGEPRYFITVKTPEDQTKTTEFMQVESPLEKAFVKREKVSGFSSALPQWYGQHHDEMVPKIISKLHHRR